MAEWLFDLGNTRLKCAPLEDGRVGEGFAVAHDGRALPDDWAEMHGMPAAENPRAAKIGRAHV